MTAIAAAARQKAGLPAGEYSATITMVGLTEAFVELRLKS